MPKVTVSDMGREPPRKATGKTPSEQLITAAEDEAAATDARGRRIGLKKPGILSQFRIVAFVGNERASNQTYMQMILPITFVTAIDDDPVTPPNTLSELEAIIKRLGEDGVNAVMMKVMETWGQRDAEADKTAIKK